MNKPFSVFKCDICGSYIDASDGMLEWLQKPTDESRDNPSAECLESIHICCRRKPCNMVYDQRAIAEGLHEQWDHLDSFIGTDNIDEILTLPMNRTIPKEKHEEFLEILRRLMIPYYEEARQYFSRAENDGLIESLRGFKAGHYVWKPDKLIEIIEEYSTAE